MWCVLSSNLTEAAKGQRCTIQLHPYCNSNPETVVFCHAPSSRKGWGLKSPDWWGAFGCSVCHDIVDGRRQVKDIGSSEIHRCFMRGIYETLAIQIESGEFAKWLNTTSK